MSYQVTARKWRPMVFEDVVGQSHITTTLRNALSTGRIAHAYVFSGQRGCGKTTTARILAKALNCPHLTEEFNPDNTCETCREITEGRSLDVIEIDGASNRGVEEIRNLRESVRYTPTQGKFKVYIIDEVHMLTKEAFNALLKTLEEPPAHVVFIFATTEIHKVPATIVSRCQRFDFRRIGIGEIMARLRFIAAEEAVMIEDDALMVIAKKGDGSLRDAQSIFDQVRSFCGNTITTTDALKTLNAVDLDVYFMVTDIIRSKEQRRGIEIIDEIIHAGYDLKEFVGGLTEHFRNLLVALSTQSTQLVEASDHYRSRYQEEAVRWDEADLLRLLRQSNDLEQSMRWAAQPRYKLEAGLLQMIGMEKSVRIGELLAQIDELKKRIGSSTSSGSDSGRTPGRGSRAAGDVRVVGSVHAGVLHTAAAVQVRREAIGVNIGGRGPVSDGSNLSSTMARESMMRPISAEEAYARWQEWVGEVRKEHISVASTLDHSRIAEVTNGSIRIACPDDYHVSTLRRNSQFLADSFRKVTGYRVRIEPEVLAGNPDVSASIPPATRSDSESAPTQLVRSVNEHPVVRALIRELGAEKVEE
jgi:DNA polymerase-3 subunit gamma/tau